MFRRLRPWLPSRRMLDSSITEAPVESKLPFPLPLELVRVVVRDLDDEFQPNYQDLGAACLVSKSWLAVARPLLYRRITRTIADLQEDASMFRSLDSGCADYVEEIEITAAGEGEPYPSLDPTLIRLLPHFVRLTCFTFAGRRGVDWEHEAVLRLFDIAASHWPRLRSLQMDSKIPLAYLLRLPTLTALQIECVEMTSVERCGPAPSFALKELDVDDVVDEADFRFFTLSSQRSLQDLTFMCSPGYPVPRLEEFSHLTTLSLCFDVEDSAQATAAKIAHLLQAIPRSLTYLRLYIILGPPPHAHPADAPIALWTLLVHNLPPQLLELKLDDFPSMTFSGAIYTGVQTPTWLPHLRHLFLSYPSNGAPDLLFSSSIRTVRQNLSVVWYKSRSAA